MTRVYPRELLDADQLTSFEVVESAYALALDGFALPYGDTPVGNCALCRDPERRRIPGPAALHAVVA